MASRELESAKFVYQKQLEEEENRLALAALRIKERRMLLGYFVVSLLATLLISGAFKLFR